VDSPLPERVAGADEHVITATERTRPLLAAVAAWRCGELCHADALVGQRVRSTLFDQRGEDSIGWTLAPD
jgi:hypothetical protein